MTSKLVFFIFLGIIGFIVLYVINIFIDVEKTVKVEQFSKSQQQKREVALVELRNKAEVPIKTLGVYKCSNTFADVGKKQANGEVTLTDTNISYLHIYPHEEPYQANVVFSFHNIISIEKINRPEDFFSVRFNVKHGIWSRPGDCISEIYFGDVSTRDELFDRLLEAKAAWDLKYPELK